jgi:hypothetical protein
MKQTLVRARLGLLAVVAAELVALAAAIAMVLAGSALPAAITVGVLVGLSCCIVTVAGLTPWQWAWLGVRWMSHRERRLAVADNRAQPKNREDADVHG